MIHNFQPIPLYAIHDYFDLKGRLMINIGYARVSRNDEVIDNQIRILVEAGIKEDHIFTDDGISGIVAPMERKGFKKMMDFVKQHDVSTIYFYELSRVSRDLTDLLNILREFDRMGVCVKSLSPNERFMQCDPSIRQLIISIMGWCAQRERENLIERTNAGIARAKAVGTHCGRPFKDFDYGYAKHLFDQGMTWREISDKMGVPYATLMRKKRMMTKSQ